MELRQSNNKNTTARHNHCKVNSIQNEILTSTFNYFNVIVADKCHLRWNDIFSLNIIILNILLNILLTSEIESCRLFEILIFHTSQREVNGAHK